MDRNWDWVEWNWDGFAFPGSHLVTGDLVMGDLGEEGTCGGGASCAGGNLGGRGVHVGGRGWGDSVRGGTGEGRMDRGPAGRRGEAWVWGEGVGSRVEGAADGHTAEPCRTREQHSHQ